MKDGMLEQIQTQLNELKTQGKELKSRQETLDQILETRADTPQNRIKNTLDGLRKLIANGTTDKNWFGTITNWVEVEELAATIREVKDQLPAGLFRQIWNRLKDSLASLERNPHDDCAVNQLQYVERVLANAMQVLQKP